MVAPMSGFVFSLLSLLLYVLTISHFIYTLVRPDHISLASGDCIGYHRALVPYVSCDSLIVNNQPHGHTAAYQIQDNQVLSSFIGLVISNLFVLAVHSARCIAQRVVYEGRLGNL